MTCQNVRKLFSDLVDGELNIADCTAVEAHLSDCSQCRDELEVFREQELQNLEETVAIVRSAFRSKRAPVGFVDKVLEATSVRPRPRWLKRMQSLHVAVFAAAALGLVIIGFIAGKWSDDYRDESTISTQTTPNQMTGTAETKGAAQHPTEAPKRAPLIVPRTSTGGRLHSSPSSVRSRREPVPTNTHDVAYTPGSFATTGFYLIDRKHDSAGWVVDSVEQRNWRMNIHLGGDAVVLNPAEPSFSWSVVTNADAVDGTATHILATIPPATRLNPVTMAAMAWLASNDGDDSGTAFSTSTATLASIMRCRDNGECSWRVPLTRLASSSACIEVEAGCATAITFEFEREESHESLIARFASDGSADVETGKRPLTYALTYYGHDPSYPGTFSFRRCETVDSEACLVAMSPGRVIEKAQQNHTPGRVTDKAKQKYIVVDVIGAGPPPSFEPFGLLSDGLLLSEKNDDGRRTSAAVKKESLGILQGTLEMDLSRVRR